MFSLSPSNTKLHSRIRHKAVTVAVGAINVFWLLPIASAVVLGVLDGFVGVLVAYMPLVWLGIGYKAGAASVDPLRPDM